MYTIVELCCVYCAVRAHVIAAYSRTYVSHHIRLLLRAVRVRSPACRAECGNAPAVAILSPILKAVRMVYMVRRACWTIDDAMKGQHVVGTDEARRR